MSEEGKNCVSLWRAVLSRAYDDCNPPKSGNWRTWGDGKNDRNNTNTFLTVAKWIITKDFEKVCDLADLNTENTKKYFIKHVLETYSLMPKHLQQKTKGVVTWLTQN